MLNWTMWVGMDVGGFQAAPSLHPASLLHWVMLRKPLPPSHLLQQQQIRYLLPPTLLAPSLISHQMTKKYINAMSWTCFAHIYSTQFLEMCFGVHQLVNSMKAVFLLHSLYWSIHTKDESKRGTALLSSLV